MYQTLTVRGLSLHGVIEDGETVLVHTHAFSVGRGSLIAFREGLGMSLKLVGGIPGDEIEVGQTLRIADRVLEFQNDAQRLVWADWAKSFDYKIPEGFLFVYGTHACSIDSRSKGLIEKERVIGPAWKTK